MKKSIKNLAIKEVKNIQAVKGGNGDDDIIKHLGGSADIKKRGGN